MNDSVIGRPSDKWIPWYFVAFFVVLTVAIAVTIALAYRSFPGIVTQNAYEKGLAYNKAIAAATHQQELGWRGQVKLTPAANGFIHAVFELKNASGDPINDAKVTLVLVRPLQEGMDVTLNMMGQGRGIYMADVALPARGQWDARLSAMVGQDNYQITERLVLP